MFKNSWFPSLSFLFVLAGMLVVPGRSFAAPQTPPLIKIMPLGDSITDGFLSDPGTGGYRLQLEKLLLAGGYNFQFVGKQTDNSSLLLPADQGHEGLSGYTIEPCDGRHGIYDPANPTTCPVGMISTYQPDVIVLLIGTNNIGTRQDPAPAIAQYVDLLNEIFLLDPHVIVLAGAIPHIGFDPKLDPNVVTFNASLKKLVQSQHHKHHIMFVSSTALPVSELQGGLHPTQAGYNIMGQDWYDAIQKLKLPHQK